jgi:HSP20 family molecular chaperone IbpA
MMTIEFSSPPSREKHLNSFLEIFRSGRSLDTCDAQSECRSDHKEFTMLFASTHPALRRNAYTQADRSLERFLRNARTEAGQPTTQYKQDETAFHLTVDVPGITKEQLSISIEGPVVRIFTREGASRQYRAAYELPLDIEASLSEAKLENGVLTLKLAKEVPANKAVEITIQ